MSLSLVLQSRLVHVPELQSGMHFGGAREKVAGKRGIAVAPSLPVSLFFAATAGNFFWRKGRGNRGLAEYMWEKGEA